MNRRTSSLILLGDPPPEQARAEAAAGLSPRFEYLEIARRLDGEILSAADARHCVRGAFAALVGRNTLLDAALAAVARRADFDAIYVTGEDLGLRLAPLLRMAGWRGRLVMVVHACTSSLRKRYLRALGPSSFHALICVCEAQRRILVEELGFRADQVLFCPNWIDTEFYDPAREEAAGQGDYIFSCGRENRDYAGLFAAAAQLDYAFKVTASGFRHAGGGLAAPPPNLTLSETRISYPELRRNYADARFVVTPLHAVSYAAGVTGVVEAMAMGKALITTASPGILDYVQDGVTGRVVPAGDPAALAEAITDLWNSPERCAEIGRRNRAWVQAHADTRIYARTIAGVMSAPVIADVTAGETQLA